MHNVGLAQESPIPGDGQVFSPEEIAKSIPGEETPPEGMEEPVAEPGVPPEAPPAEPAPESGGMVYIDKMGNDIVIIKYLQPGQQPTPNAEDPKFPRGPFPDSPETIQKEMEAVKREVGQAPSPETDIESGEVEPVGSEKPMPESPISDMPTADKDAGPESFEPLDQGTPPSKEAAGCEGAGCMECEEYVSDIDIALGLKKGQIKTVIEDKKIDALSVGGILKSTSTKSAKGAHEAAQAEFKQMKPAVESTVFKSPGNKKTTSESRSMSVPFYSEHPAMRGVINARNTLYHQVIKPLRDKHQNNKQIYDALYYGITNADDWDQYFGALKTAYNLLSKVDPGDASLLSRGMEAITQEIRSVPV